jgi:hypothetical protein
MSVSVGSDDLKDSIIDGQERNVEGSATQVEDQNVFLSFLLVHAIGDGSSGRLIDDSHHVESGNNAGVLGGLALSIIEVLWEKENLNFKFFPVLAYIG